MTEERAVELDRERQVAERNSGSIGRITTAGALTPGFPIPTAGADPLGLVAAPDGGLLIADHAGSALDHMTLDGTFSREARLRSAPDAIALGPDGALWYVSGDDAKIGRVAIDR